MSYNSKIDPTEPFPEDLRLLDDCALHVLNSKVHRELDAEYAQGFPEMETEFRKEELAQELNRRASSAIAGKRPRLLRAV
ncbi:hypothetical protein [Arthrobacter sp.]|uniref:hypothetical protein n=1 Tax=Arthrobacter sp. TaxID=1667 RepID=UPI002810CE8D|nr:hypothetical protein [Arthrobacter sp.]